LDLVGPLNPRLSCQSIFLDPRSCPEDPLPNPDLLAPPTPASLDPPRLKWSLKPALAPGAASVRGPPESRPELIGDPRATCLMRHLAAAPGWIPGLEPITNA
jgi:hypothetical protein